MYTNSVIFCVVNLVITVNSECKLSASDTRYESKLCSSKHIADAVSEVSECKPRPVVVELPWPNNTNIHRMTPTHVEVYKCGGGCQTSQSSTVCVPTLTRKRSIPVMLASCGLGAGRCPKQCAGIDVDEHLQCECNCDPNVEDQCNQSEDHVFIPETCQCHCRDYQARTECQDSGHQWSDATCTCLLPALDDLTPLLAEDKTVITETDKDDDKDDDGDEDDNMLTREIIVIGLLLVINSCLFFIMILLIARLRKMKQTVQDMDDSKSEYYQVNPDERDDSYLRGPKVIPNNTYSDIDIYSASSGFISEDGSSKHEEVENIKGKKVDFEAYYETAESVRLKKYQLKESYREQKPETELTYERAIQSIDETMKMLQESVEKI